MRFSDLSVIIISYNESANIARCLESVRGCGEIVLVDSFSTDDTVEIATRYAATIFRRPFESAADQKNWALERVRNRWVLIIDADEAVTAGLREEIEALDPDAEGIVGYWIRRRSWYMGRFISGCGWQRDKVLRLFDRERGRYDEVAVHEEVSINGPVRVLRNRLDHFPYRDLQHHAAKIGDYSERGASEYVKRGGRAAFLNMLLHPPFRFLRMYVFQLGFRDGRQGLVLCLMAAYSVFLKYAKAWERGTWNRLG